MNASRDRAQDSGKDGQRQPLSTGPGSLGWTPALRDAVADILADALLAEYPGDGAASVEALRGHARPARKAEPAGKRRGTAV